MASRCPSGASGSRSLCSQAHAWPPQGAEQGRVPSKARPVLPIFATAMASGLPGLAPRGPPQTGSAHAFSPALSESSKEVLTGHTGHRGGKSQSVCAAGGLVACRGLQAGSPQCIPSTLIHRAAPTELLPLTGTEDGTPQTCLARVLATRQAVREARGQTEALRVWGAGCAWWRRPRSLFPERALAQLPPPRPAHGGWGRRVGQGRETPPRRLSAFQSPSGK